MHLDLQFIPLLDTNNSHQNSASYQYYLRVWRFDLENDWLLQKALVVYDITTKVRTNFEIQSKAGIPSMLINSESLKSFCNRVSFFSALSKYLSRYWSLWSHSYEKSQQAEWILFTSFDNGSDLCWNTLYYESESNRNKRWNILHQTKEFELNTIYCRTYLQYVLGTTNNLFRHCRVVPNTFVVEISRLR